MEAQLYKRDQNLLRIKFGVYFDVILGEANKK